MKPLIAAAGLVVATAASNLATRETTAALHASFSTSKGPYAKVVNRCSYDVYLWSIEQELGCAAEASIVLKTGEAYRENYRSNANGGVSIKLSKSNSCSGKDITQLEYKIVNDTADYNGNFLDMSFVDCTNNLEDCPGRTDGFYLKAGNQNGKYTSAVDNEHCPVFSVYNAEEAAKVSYINWNDPQTKWCNQEANLSLYLCGGDAGDDSAAPSSSAAPSTEVVSSSAQPTSSSSSSEEAPASSTTEEAPASPTTEEAPASSTTEEAFVVAAAAAITEAPAAPAVPAVKTEVVYVTEFVKARHAHGRRHQHFHA